MRVHRTKYTDKRTGRLKPSPTWHVHLKDTRAEWQRLPAFTDKSASEKLGRRVAGLKGRYRREHV